MRTGIKRLRSSSNPADGPTFVVERFAWGAPDRLEVAGTFSGLAATTPADGAGWAAGFGERERAGGVRIAGVSPGRRRRAARTSTALGGEDGERTNVTRATAGPVPSDVVRK
jgi:hypothetical protein